MSSKKSTKEKSLGNDFVVIGNTMMRHSLPKVACFGDERPSNLTGRGRNIGIN
jgi:hypothetical protein